MSEDRSLEQQGDLSVGVDMRRLIAFLYLLMRDHITSGNVEEIMLQVRVLKSTPNFSAPDLANYARSLAIEILDPITTPLEVKVEEMRSQLNNFPSVVSWYRIHSTGRMVAATFLDRDRDEAEMGELARAIVTVEGHEYQCVGVERYLHLGPWRKGEPIGLAIEGSRK